VVPLAQLKRKFKLHRNQPRDYNSSFIIKNHNNSLQGKYEKISVCLLSQFCFIKITVTNSKLCVNIEVISILYKKINIIPNNHDNHLQDLWLL